ncbi:tigger transposable element-derived protein 6-like [Rhizophagus irregularis DAOM 181602=DAOM 197198]|nr:tigger transposable element-derived protein 6-like [Rhizophagus irregularis DAOM 181602=DAOM 197198]
MTQTRMAISDEIKYKICNYQIKNPNISHENIAIYFNRLHNINIKRPTISKILKDRERWLSITNNTSSTYRHREVKYPSLEQALSIWVKQALSKNMILSDNILREKAKEFAQDLNIAENAIGFSNGCEPLSTLPELRAELQELISKYDPNDVFNFDETGLFYRMTPNQTLASGPVSGTKKDYDIFRHWIKILDNKFRVQKWQVLILLNNASSHLEPKKKEANNNELYNSDETSAAESSHAAKNKKGKKRAVSKSKKSRQLFDDLSQPLELTNITIKYLPPNTTSHLQPMDQGIINNFKVSNKFECYFLKLNLLEAINYLSDAWLDVSQNTISNCWAKAGILPSVNHVQREVASDQIDMELDVEFEEIEELFEILPDIGTPFLDDIDHYIKELEELPVEEFLDDKQIIEYVTKDSSEEVISDSEPELEIISIKEAAQGLKTFITFFTQQSDHSGFCSEDLKIFNKYSKLMNVKLFESKKQTSIDSFFN